MHKVGEKFRLVKIQKDEEDLKKQTPDSKKGGIYRRNNLSI
jgi:hypothetical protein